MATVKAIGYVEVQVVVRQKVKDISAQTGGKGIVADLKGRPRATSKAQFKYADQRGEIAWYHLSDLVRGTIQHRTIQGMYDSLNAIIDDPEIDEEAAPDDPDPPPISFDADWLEVRLPAVSCSSCSAFSLSFT